MADNHLGVPILYVNKAGGCELIRYKIISHLFICYSHVSIENNLNSGDHKLVQKPITPCLWVQISQRVKLNIYIYARERVCVC